MDFRLTCASSWFGISANDIPSDYPEVLNSFQTQKRGDNVFIKIESLDDLRKLQDVTGQPMIVDFSDGPWIEIYDTAKE